MHNKNSLYPPKPRLKLSFKPLEDGGRHPHDEGRRPQDEGHRPHHDGRRRQQITIPTKSPGKFRTKYTCPLGDNREVVAEKNDTSEKDSKHDNHTPSGTLFPSQWSIRKLSEEKGEKTVSEVNLNALKRLEMVLTGYPYVFR